MYTDEAKITKKTDFDFRQCVKIFSSVVANFCSNVLKSLWVFCENKTIRLTLVMSTKLLKVVIMQVNKYGMSFESDE